MRSVFDFVRQIYSLQGSADIFVGHFELLGLSGNVIGTPKGTRIGRLVTDEKTNEKTRIHDCFHHSCLSKKNREWTPIHTEEFAFIGVHSR